MRRCGPASAAARTATSGAEGESRQPQGRIRPAPPSVGDDRQCVRGLAATLVVTALARADTAEIEADGGCPSCSSVRASVYTTLLSMLPP